MSFDYKNLVENLVRNGLIVGDSNVGFKVNPYLEMPRSLSFSDVALKQGENLSSSRLDTDIRSEFARGLYLDIPLIAANMSSVVNADFCIQLRKLGALGIMHRAYASEADYIEQVKKIAKESDIVAASVGVGLSQIGLAAMLVSAGANVIVIDIAQGYSKAVIETGREIKKKNPHIKLVVGNTINTQLMYEVDDFADAVKVGIAQGSACLTKNTAGCTKKQWTAVNEFKEVSKKLGLPIISDGSIKEAGDFTKSIAAGANSAMAGSIFARCPESAAELVDVDGTPKKVYFGMASRMAQDKWRGGLKPGTCPEGQTLYLSLGESVANLLERYSGALRSGLTYVGSRNINEFQERATFERL
jgi:IMP dehydrogenase/GMP reductase